MVIAIAIIFSQVFISGMLLNFLIFTPYLKAKYSKFIKPEQVTQSQNALFRALLSGQIQCLEFTRAVYNSICGVFYFGLVLTITIVESMHSDQIRTIVWQLEN